MNDHVDENRISLTSMGVSEERLQALKELFPEAFTEGKVDFEKLRKALGELVDDSPERYGLSWAGKSQAVRAVQSLSSGTLAPCKEESVNWDTTGNLIIEGDNLEVLKLLQRSYYGKVKMIYIDPPYNTGNDFIYPDDYRDPLGEYLRITSQVDENGARLATNPETNGRYHSNWLNMMYPRLFLARNLLAPDGAVFISVDENEFHNLRALSAEVFGDECFVAAITVLCNPKGRSQDKYFATNHEYVLVYSRVVLPKGAFSLEKDEEQIEAEYPEEDEGGKYRTLELRNTHREFGRHNRRNLYYPLYVGPDEEVSLDHSDGATKVLPVWEDGYEGCWTWEKERVRRDGYLLVGRQVKGRWKVFRKSYASGAERMLKTLLVDKAYYTERGQKEFNKLFQTKAKIFQSPKSPFLIAQLAQTIVGPSEVVLDFFAGSGTTAQAVLELNKEDGGNRNFILVQLPEPTGNKEFPTIADICKERVRRVIKKLNDEDNGKLDLKESPQDRGFKVFKLTTSNFKLWNADKAPKDAEKLARHLRLFADHIFPGRTQDQILYEILLKAGIELGAPVETKTVAGQKVFSVNAGALLVCLEDPITHETLKGTIDLKPGAVICLDHAFSGNDQLKTNVVLEMRSHDIKFQTV